MNTQTVIVDVRDDILSGREPFAKIMKAVGALRPDEQLQLIAPFEPVPLFGVMEKQGFTHSAKPTGSGDWEVLFTRGLQTRSENCNSANGGKVGALEFADDFPMISAAAPGDGRTLVAAAKVVEVDARGLEPPQPMVKILEAVAVLAMDEELRARTDRRPMHLYPHLEERGFKAVTEEQPDGSFFTHIRRG